MPNTGIESAILRSLAQRFNQLRYRLVACGLFNGDFKFFLMTLCCTNQATIEHVIFVID